jgi:hypothetical protein
LQIKHQMRLMEHEAHTLGGGAGRDNGVPKSKDARLADIDPIEVDSSTDWSSVGGLDAHVNALKEMVVLPLLYPELFQKFYVQPPKGVLFFGRTWKHMLVQSLRMGDGIGFVHVLTQFLLCSCFLFVATQLPVLARRWWHVRWPTHAVPRASVFRSLCARGRTGRDTGSAHACAFAHAPSWKTPDCCVSAGLVVVL